MGFTEEQPLPTAPPGLTPPSKEGNHGVPSFSQLHVWQFGGFVF